jgi:DNA primase
MNTSGPPLRSKSLPNLTSATLDTKKLASLENLALNRSIRLPMSQEKQKILPPITRVGKTVLKVIVFIGYAIFKLFSCLIPCIGKSSSKANLAALSTENERLAQQNSELRAQVEKLMPNKEGQPVLAENQPLQDKATELAANPTTQQDQDKVAVLENVIVRQYSQNETLTAENQASIRDWNNLEQLVNSSSNIFETDSSRFDDLGVDSGVDSDNEGVDLEWDYSDLPPHLTPK